MTKRDLINYLEKLSIPDQAEIITSEEEGYMYMQEKDISIVHQICVYELGEGYASVQGDFIVF